MPTSRYVSPEDARAMMQIAHKSRGPFAVRNELILRMLYGTGITIAEFASVTMGQIYDEDGHPRHELEVKSRPMFLIDPELRRVLDSYYRWRKEKFPFYGVIPFNHPDSNLLVDENGRPFDLVQTREIGADDDNKIRYYSFPALSALVRELHESAGVKDGNAESARRSWSVWLAGGLDGRAPMHLEWLKVIRGDKRLSTTVEAIRKDLAGVISLKTNDSIAQFMRMR